jgi:hypothetical protein
MKPTTRGSFVVVRPQKKMRLLPLILASSLVCCVGVRGETRNTCTFPGTPTHCSDPRGQWDIEWREPSGSGRHVLWLRAAGARTKLLEFDRSVEVMWSPDGRALAVTDRTGSSGSVVRVFTGGTLHQVVTVEKPLRTSLGGLPEIFANGHRYFEAVGWVNNEVLQFRVRAYDREPGKEYVGLFRYNLAGSVTRELVQ